MTDRRRSLLLAAITTAIGLAVHLGGSALPFAVRDSLGDALWAAMMFWLVSACSPHSTLRRRALIATAIAFSVEVSQLYHAPWIDGVRANRIVHLVLGSGFDARDLAAYVLGLAAAVVVDRTIHTQA